MLPGFPAGSKNSFTLLSLPFIFTVWLMFSDLSRFVSAFDLHAPGVAA